MAQITNTEDVLDSRDIIERLEELQGEREMLADELADAIECVKFHHDGVLDETGTFGEHDEYRRCRDELADWDEENGEELKALEALAKQGEDFAEDWKYGAQLIRDSYFEDYAQELAEEIGAINPNAGWPNNCIDWERAARELQMDYTSIDYDGITYWVR